MARRPVCEMGRGRSGSLEGDCVTDPLSGDDGSSGSDARFSALAEAAADAIITAGEDGIITSWNPAATRMFGYGPGEAIGRPISILVPPTSLAAHEAGIRRFAARGERHLIGRVVEVSGMSRDGTQFPVELTLSEWEASGSQFVTAIIRDVSARRLGDAVIRASLERLRAIFEEAPLGVGVIDSLDGRIYEANPRYCEIAGRTREDMTQRDWMSITHPDDVQPDLDNMARMNAGEIPGFAMEKRYIRPDGSVVWISQTVAQLRSGDPSRPRHLAMIKDISERREAREAVRRSEARLQALFENMPAGLAHCRMEWADDGRPTDWTYLSVNDAFGTLTGLRNAAGRRVTELIPGIADTNPELFEIYPRVAAGGQPERFETYVAPIDEWLDVSVYSPEPGEFVAIFTVVTDRVRAEQELRATHERLQLAQRSAASGAWDIDLASGRFTWQAELFELFGLDPATSEASFETWRSVVHPADLAAAEARRTAAIADHVPLASEYRVVLPSGGIRWIDALGDTVYDADGRPLRLTGICIDVTERARPRRSRPRSKPSSSRPRRWSRWAAWRAAWPTTSTTCWASSSATRSWRSSRSDPAQPLLRGPRGDPQGGQALGRPDPPAAGLRPQADRRAQGARPERDRGRACSRCCGGSSARTSTCGWQPGSGSVAGQDGPVADRPDPGQPVRQRPRRHRRRRRRSPSRRPTCALDEATAPATAGPCPGDYVRARRERRRLRHGPGDAGAHLRAVLHHQGRRARAPASGWPPSTASSSRTTASSTSAASRGGHDVQDLPAPPRGRARRGAAGRAAAAGTVARPRDHPAGGGRAGAS